MALLVMYTLPGPLIIYYGTEVPLSQRQSIHAKGAQGFDEARLPMDWDAVQTSSLPGYLAKLAEIRQTHPKIYQSSWRLFSYGEHKDFIVLTKFGGGYLYLLINRSKKPIRWVVNDISARKFYDLVEGTHFTAEHGQMTLTIAPYSAMLISAI